MLSTIIIRNIASILLSLDRKMKAMLGDLCWFNNLHGLTESDIPEPEDVDLQMAKGWSQLWECVSQTLRTGFRQQRPRQKHFILHFQYAQLCRRKRDELIFSFRNSSLQQLLVCRHASGADSDHQADNDVISPQSTMRLFAIVLFLLSEFKRISYVHCLCGSLSNWRGSYLYGR